MGFNEFCMINFSDSILLNLLKLFSYSFLFSLLIFTTGKILLPKKERKKITILGMVKTTLAIFSVYILIMGIFYLLEKIT